jgi:hypothetical protein
MAIVAGSTPMSEHGKSKDETSLEEQTMRHLEKIGSMSVQSLYETLRVRNPWLAEEQVTDLVWRLAEDGLVNLEDTAPAASSLPEYLRFWERNIWLYLSLVVSFTAIFAIYAIPSESPFVALRWALSLLLVLFIPGYLTLEALFPGGGQLDTIERLALSVALSLTLVMFVGLLLNYSPGGIRLSSILISLTILTAGVAVVALAREYRTSTNRRQA